MADTLAHSAKKHYDGIKYGRGTWEGHWREVAKFTYPQADDFWQNASSSSHGEKKSYFIYESTPRLELRKFASLMESLIMPRDQRWHRLEVDDPVVQRDTQSRKWLERVTDILFKLRYSSRANFQSQTNEAFMSIGAFGNGPLYIDQYGTGLRYSSCFIGDFYFDVNFQHIMDVCYKRFDYSHHQALQRWGDKAPEKARKGIEDDPHERMSYVHAVLPNDHYDPQAKGVDGMPLSSVYFLEETGEQCGDIGGYTTMPYTLGRFQTSPHEIVGRGPAMDVLPDIRTLNEMARSDLRATHKLVDPPLLVHDDGVIGAGQETIYLDPGGINYGGVSPDGRPLIMPLQTGARVDLNEAKMEVKRQAIRDAFLSSLFQLSEETKRMTATEVIARAREQASIVGPIAGRIQSEFIGPLIDRELALAMENSWLPEPPPMIRDALSEGGYSIIYESPLARLQLAERLQGIDMTLQMAVQLANAGDESVLLALNAPAIMRHVQHVGGAPEDIIRSAEEVERLQEQRAQQQSSMATMESASNLAKAQKDMAQAQAIEAGR